MKSAFLKTPLPAVLLLSVILTTTSCSRQAKSSRHLVATIEPLHAIVSEVAGSGWQVSTIVPQGFSPEDYSPSATEMADVADAMALFQIGRLGFEMVWIPKAQSTMPSLHVVDTSNGINTATFDPHSWTSPRNIKVIAANVSHELCHIDSAHAADYTMRLENLKAKADSLDSTIAQTLRQLPSRSFVITHPALTHFAADYNLHQLAIEPDGKEPTPASIQALIEQAKADGTKVVFVQKEFSDRNARMIARQIGATVIDINPLAADWQAQLLHIANSLKNGR